MEKKFIRRRTIEEIQNLKGIYELRLANIENELSKKNDENLLNLKKDYEKIIDDLIEEHTSEIETLKKEMEDLQEEIKKGSSKSYKPKKYNKGTYRSDVSKEDTKSYYEIKMKDATNKYRYNQRTYELSDEEDSKLQEVLPFEYEIDRTSTKNLANLVDKQEIEKLKSPDRKLKGAKKIEIEIKKKVITDDSSEDELEKQLKEEEERREKERLEKEKKKEEERLERERKKEEERIAREKEKQERERQKEEERKERERKKEEERIAREKEKQERERQKEEERKERERKAEQERKEKEKKLEQERKEKERKAEQERKRLEKEKKKEEERLERERKKEEERIAREKEKQERERQKEEERKERELKSKNNKSNKDNYSKDVNGLLIEKNSSNSSSTNEINKKNKVLLSPSSLEETKDSPMKNTYNKFIAPENSNGKKLNFTSSNLTKDDINKANLKRPNKFNDKSIEGSIKRPSSVNHGKSTLSMQYFIDDLMNIYNNIEKYNVEKILDDSEFSKVYNRVKEENYEFKNNLFFPNLKDLHVNAGTFDKVSHKHTVSMSGMNDLLLNIESPETIYKYYESKV